MDPDLNKYDIEHVCAAHAKMSKQEWEADLSGGLVALLLAGAHEDAAAARGGDRRADGQPGASCWCTFATTVRLENVHPLQSGHSPPQASLRAPARLAARERLDLLAALRLGDA